MAISTKKNRYKSAVSTKGKRYKRTNNKNYKGGGALPVDVSGLSRGALNDYIQKKYSHDIKSASITFRFSDGFEYDFNDSSAKAKLIEYYENKSDFTEDWLAKTDDNPYKMDGWSLIREEFDYETNENIGGYELEEILSDNTYNGTYLGLLDINYRLFEDETFGKFFVVAHIQLGGDPRGNYMKALILEGDDKDELMERFSDEFIYGSLNVNFEFSDGSSADFYSDSEFILPSYQSENDVEEGTLAYSIVNDFEKFSSESDSDEFLEEVVGSTSIVTNKALGGDIGDSDSPKAFIRILGEKNESKEFDLSEYSDGDEVLEAITNWMNELNDKDGLLREEWEVIDWEGFGRRYYSEYMSESDFEEVINAYESFENSDYSYGVINEYMKEVGTDDMEEAISKMESTNHGTYDSIADFAEQMMEGTGYTPHHTDMFVTDTDKRIISGEDADNRVSDMSFGEKLDKADMESEFDSRRSDLEDEIDELALNVSSLEESLNTLEGDDYDLMTETLADAELELSEKQTELDDLEDDMMSEVEDKARDVIYEEVYEELENDLTSYLEAREYTDFSKVNFVRIDYDAVGNELSTDYTVIEDEDGSMIFFDNTYGNGGRVVSVGKINKNHKFYVVEMKSKKIISGFDSKKEANESKKELTKNNSKSRFSVATKETVNNKYKLDTTTYKDWLDISEIKFSDKVSINMGKRNKASLNGLCVKRKGGDITLDWSDMENDDMRNCFISLFNDLKDSEFQIENYKVDSLKNIVIYFRKEKFTDIEKFKLNRFISKYTDYRVKPLFCKFINEIKVDGNRIYVYSKDEIYSKGGDVGCGCSAKSFEKGGEIDRDPKWNYDESKFQTRADFLKDILSFHLGQPLANSDKEWGDAIVFVYNLDKDIYIIIDEEDDVVLGKRLETDGNEPADFESWKVIKEASNIKEFNELMKEAEKYNDVPPYQAYFDKQDSFELGIPVVYHSLGSDGKPKEVSGEVIIGEEPIQKGILIYPNENYSGSNRNFIAPNWNNVETFNESMERGDSEFKITDIKYDDGGSIPKEGSADYINKFFTDRTDIKKTDILAKNIFKPKNEINSIEDYADLYGEEVFLISKGYSNDGEVYFENGEELIEVHQGSKGKDVALAYFIDDIVEPISKDMLNEIINKFGKDFTITLYTNRGVDLHSSEKGKYKNITVIRPKIKY